MTAITFTELIEAFAAEGITAHVEDTGGGCATLIIDGGAVQVGPGIIGEGFDTDELSYGFYTVDENGDAEEASDAVWFEDMDFGWKNTSDARKATTTAQDIARATAIAYLAHKGVEFSEGDKVIMVTALTKGHHPGYEWTVSHVRPSRGRATLTHANGAPHALNPIQIDSVPLSALVPLVADTSK
ncbi:hypothetical protein SEA_ROSIEPOSIE_36 [Arthrobacter phage RosiePosie]|uniref:Uncharacterized protein n=10 Tax=Klausavirus princesstrina TaxID=1984784 RepID=A0A286N449_9CAUD|nr:hypothetical protein SEA_CHUBSTER_36 [Arthrobacter phage Chubster]AOZ64701.1 hypothetical protein SEA_CHOCOLAT_36 [Arthrobacter phage Chocolat]APC44831.1 hypothetical protein SEA_HUMPTYDUMPTY_36 [Arthrobacter phage HumptyDumpty]ASX98821.1 hypothetical protein SEA_KABREEZE_36 [Arthrobacter phage Kabreeze]ASX98932.1 hypothetical protein SEA_ROSIEPOSIE_36 [Arthrobacter phage RosiePosie]ASX99044.1 hypothetical protein SEA_SCAVITO_36 [Arthrobacter phage Scavito]ASX99156.1 hypothetical protein S